MPKKCLNQVPVEPKPSGFVEAPPCLIVPVDPDGYPGNTGHRANARRQKAGAHPLPLRFRQNVDCSQFNRVIAAFGGLDEVGEPHYAAILFGRKNLRITLIRLKTILIGISRKDMFFLRPQKFFC